ncbi:hypothetical protein [Phytoactinopolyspora limicola]|uniref:hypothetical protein n=1 Tax=Phytoactinopolyspora limicola TaxID=2715536 RepID=UPI001408B436|nr:hypothetical protein [Phytoactinopolyspora limicola]
MTDHQPSGDDRGIERETDVTAAQLAALALVRLCIRDEPAQLSIDLLTNDHGGVDVHVVQELVFLTADLTRAVATTSGVDVEEMLDELVGYVVTEGGETE